MGLEIVKHERNIVSIITTGGGSSSKNNCDDYEVFIEHYLDEPQYMKSLGIFRKYDTINIDLNQLTPYFLRASVNLIFRYRKNNIISGEENFLFNLPSPLNLRIKDPPLFLCCGETYNKSLIWDTASQNNKINYQVFLRWKREGQIGSSFREIKTKEINLCKDILPKEPNLHVWIEFKYTPTLSLYSNTIILSLHTRT